MPEFELTQDTVDTLDAKRYRYLRDLCDRNPHGPIVCCGHDEDFDFLRGADLDYAIDTELLKPA